MVLDADIMGESTSAIGSASVVRTIDRAVCPANGVSTLILVPSFAV